MFFSKNVHKYNITVSLGTKVEDKTLFNFFLEKYMRTFNNEKTSAVKTPEVERYMQFLKDNIDTLNNVINGDIDKQFSINEYGNSYFVPFTGYIGDKECLIKGPLYFDEVRTSNGNQHAFIKGAYSTLVSFAAVEGTAVNFVKDPSAESFVIPSYDYEKKAIILEKAVMQK